MSFAAFLTEATCGEACWHARENICRCSCGGKNHGILCSPYGEQPVRQSRINGYRYELHAVGNAEDIFKQFAEETKNLPPRETVNISCVEYDDSGDSVPSVMTYVYKWAYSDTGSPYRITSVTKTQLQNWKELSGLDKNARLLWKQAESNA